MRRESEKSRAIPKDFFGPLRLSHVVAGTTGATEIQAIATKRVAIAVARTSKGTAHDKNKKTCSCT